MTPIEVEGLKDLEEQKPEYVPSLAMQAIIARVDRLRQAKEEEKKLVADLRAEILERVELYRNFGQQVAVEFGPRPKRKRRSKKEILAAAQAAADQALAEDRAKGLTGATAHDAITTALVPAAGNGGKRKGGK